MSTKPFQIVKVTAWLWNPVTETYGTGFDLQQPNMLTDTPIYDNDESRSKGTQVDTLNVLVGRDLTLGFGGIDDVGFSKLKGNNGNAYYDDTGGDDTPYFGLAVALKLKGGKERHHYYPLVQAQGDIEVSVGVNNEFNDVELEMRAMTLETADGTQYTIRKYEIVAADTAFTDIGTKIGLS